MLSALRKKLDKIRDKNPLPEDPNKWLQDNYPRILLSFAHVLFRGKQEDRLLAREKLSNLYTLVPISEVLSRLPSPSFGIVVDTAKTVVEILQEHYPEELREATTKASTVSPQPSTSTPQNTLN